MISEQLKDSTFVLTFSGEATMAVVIHGWDALIETIHREYTVNDDEHAELLVRLEDEDEWIHDNCTDFLPWHYSEATGEIGYMSIYRVNSEHVPGDICRGINRELGKE